jgi:hypothetical protein
VVKRKTESVILDKLRYAFETPVSHSRLYFYLFLFACARERERDESMNGSPILINKRIGIVDDGNKRAHGTFTCRRIVKITQRQRESQPTFVRISSWYMYSRVALFKEVVCLLHNFFDTRNECLRRVRAVLCHFLYLF